MENESVNDKYYYFPMIIHHAKSLQSCPTLCDPIDGSPPGSPVPGILQARTLEWVAISFSNAWKWKVKVKSPSRVWLLATTWTAAHQAPPSMGFSRQEYWIGVPLPSPSLAWDSCYLSLRRGHLPCVTICPLSFPPSTAFSFSFIHSLILYLLNRYFEFFRTKIMFKLCSILWWRSTVSCLKHPMISLQRQDFPSWHLYFDHW